jgi:hypothetical protein
MKEEIVTTKQPPLLVTPPHIAGHPFSSERIIIGLTGDSFVVLSVWSLRMHGRAVYGAHLIENAALERTTYGGSVELAEVAGTRTGLRMGPSHSIADTTRQAKALLARSFGKIKWQKAVNIPRVRSPGKN